MALQDSLQTNQPILQNNILIKKDEVIEFCNETLIDWGFSGDFLIYLRTGIILVAITLLSVVLWWTTRKLLIKLIYTFASKSKTTWDDHLVKNKFFAALAHLVPLMLMDKFIYTIFYSFPKTALFFNRVTILVIILVVLYAILRFLNTAKDVLKEKPRLKDKPIDSYIQLGKIIISGILIVSMISVAIGVELVEIFISLGAATAVLLLVFKDTILGFVGSIQLAANDMIRIGDWVTMEKYGADGDVLEINLATVKVQNFDKTITTIPTYSFISDSFKNWRGMEESGGRRLVRSIHIKIDSIEFCTPDMLHHYGEIELIRGYIDKKEQEIIDFNNQNEVNKSVLLNGRNQTNLGVFRYYVEEYLKHTEGINETMTLMVRQLTPTDKGVPIQVYAFTKTKDWPKYEAVSADIFDHLLAAVNYFDLEVFENPAGSDMRTLAEKKS